MKNKLLGNSSSFSLSLCEPHLDTFPFDPLETPSFKQRLMTMCSYYFYRPIKRFFSTSVQENLLVELGLVDTKLDLLDVESTADFGMYFSHYLFDAIRPTLPNTIDIGMIHCQEARSVVQSPFFISQFL